MRPTSDDDLPALASRALDEEREEEAIPPLEAALQRRPDDGRLLHWLALLHRGLDRRERALPLLRRACALAPGDAGLAHSLARVTVEAELPAAALYEAAIRLAPGNVDLRLGLASARLAEGEGARALDELGALLSGNPGWIEGHRAFAQMAVLAGMPDRSLASIAQALARFPAAPALHLLAADLMLAGGRAGPALEVTARALTAVGGTPAVLVQRAAALGLAGQHGEAAAVFARLGPLSTAEAAVWHARHLLATGEARACGEVVAPWLVRAGAEALWPYAALAWRLTGDPRSEWLEMGGDLLAVVDLDFAAGELETLAAELRQRHRRSGRFLDQSVRGGTQTDGPLFAAVAPAITGLRERLRAAVRSVAADLPAPPAWPGCGAPPAHPLLSLPRPQRPRFAGSWSVRLVDSGHHVPHHHPQGWLSSAFYVVVPEGLQAGDGAFELGAPPHELGLDLPALRRIEPRPGRLVLFPSWSWHGTRPFAAGERMSVAFDIARPR